MVGFFALLMAGGALLALSGVMDDDAAPDPAGDGGGDGETWDGDEIRVTELGSEPELIVPEEIDDSAFPGSDLSGYAGSSADELIETNTSDDTYQLIDGGGGDDVVEAGMGDMVDLRSEDEETGDDIEGEEGDLLTVSVSQDDLDAAPQLSVFEYLSGGKGVDVSDGDIPIFQARLGSGDSLDIELPDGAGGSVHVVEDEVTTYIGGTASSGAQLESFSGRVLYVPEGKSLPEGVRSQEDYFFFSGIDDSELPFDALDGVRLLGRIDLGEELLEGWLDDTTEPPDPDEPVPPNYTLGYDHRVDMPTLTVGGRGV